MVWDGVPEGRYEGMYDLEQCPYQHYQTRTMKRQFFSNASYHIFVGITAGSMQQ